MILRHSFEPVDNLRLAHLSGAFDAHLRSIEAALGVRIGRVFLGGHSQGGYLVTRLNTLHEVDGVVLKVGQSYDLPTESAEALIASGAVKKEA